MNKLKKFLFLLIACALGTAAFAGTDLSASKPSNQENVEFIDSEDSGWVVLVKEIDNQRFVLEFPERPTLKKLDDNRSLFSCQHGGIDYRLTVDSRAPKGGNDLWMQDLLREAVQDSSKSLVNFFVAADLFSPFMEISYAQDGKVVREKNFIRSGHIFSISSEGASEGDDRFFQSFQIFDTP